MKKYHYKIDIDGDDAPARVLRMVGQGKRVLELGCASGVQSRFLKEKLSCDVTGIELDPSAAAEARRFCESVYVGDLDVLDLTSVLKEATFDVILLADVVEHLRNPVRVLTASKMHLAPGGILLASIPNVVHAGLIVDMLNGRFDYRSYGLLDDTHVRFYTRKSIFKLFEQAGYAIVALDRVRFPPEHTEFYSRPYTEEEHAIFAYARVHNPEWDTFQFIVKAAPSDDSLRVSHALLEAEDRIKDLEAANASLVEERKRLESQISWVQRQPAYRLLSAVKGFFR